MKNRMERILAVIGAICLLLCLAPTFQADQPDGTDDLTALRSLYEAGLELERTGFRVLEENQISIREVPGEATDQADLLVVEILPDEQLEPHAADLVLQMFIRGDKVYTLRQEILLVPGETMELAFRASSEDLLSGCFRVFLMDKDDHRLSPPDQCYCSVMLKDAAGGNSLEFLGPYIPQGSADDPDTSPAGPLPQETESTAPPSTETQPQQTDPTGLPDVDPSDTPLPDVGPTLPAPPEASQPTTSEDGKDISDDILDF